MSDISDAIPKAVALNKKLAASLMVKKEELEASIARIQAQGGNVEALSADLASTEQSLAVAIKEISELRRLAEQGGIGSVASIQALSASDPIAVSAEDRALELARAGIAELEAEAGLAPSLASPSPSKPSREEAEAQALQAFEALREQSKIKKTM